MSKPPTNGKDEEEEIPPPQRPPSPPLHTTFAARGVLVRVLLEPMRFYEM
jgi:THO complex subunit 3